MATNNTPNCREFSQHQAVLSRSSSCEAAHSLFRPRSLTRKRHHNHLLSLEITPTYNSYNSSSSCSSNNSS